VHHLFCKFLEGSGRMIGHGAILAGTIPSVPEGGLTLWPSLNSILDLRVSQVRNGNFCPSALERGTRCEQVVNLALAERHVQGVSTRAPRFSGRRNSI